MQSTEGGGSPLRISSSPFISGNKIPMYVSTDIQRLTEIVVFVTVTNGWNDLFGLSRYDWNCRNSSVMFPDMVGMDETIPVAFSNMIGTDETIPVTFSNMIRTIGENILQL
jgi:hypothetical protein